MGRKGMRAPLLVTVATATLVLISGAAGAKNLPAGGMTIAEIAKWLQGEGYKAEVRSDKSEKYLESSADGQNFQIYQYDCDKAKRCGSFQFQIGYDTKGSFSPDKVNDWNKENRWVRVYADKVNDPWVELDVDLTPGGTFELLDDEFGVWRMSLGHFHKFAFGN
jgi:hypothetical protein